METRDEPIKVEEVKGSNERVGSWVAAIGRNRLLLSRPPKFQEEIVCGISAGNVYTDTAK